MSTPSPLSPPMLAFLAAPRFAVLASLDRGGAPRQAVVWYRLEPDGTPRREQRRRADLAGQPAPRRTRRPGGDVGPTTATPGWA